jgi:hypothetical protein
MIVRIRIAPGKTANSIVMSAVRLSIGKEQCDSHRNDCREIHYVEIYATFCRKISILAKTGQK